MDEYTQEFGDVIDPGEGGDALDPSGVQQTTPNPVDSTVPPPVTPPPVTTPPPAEQTASTENETSTLTPDQQALQDATDAYQAAATNVQTTIENIQNGVIPLTTAEQAQVEGLQQQFQALIDQQTLSNTSASGIANIRGYQTGSAEYDPNFQVKVIGSIVTAGINKIADLNIKMASSVAALTQSFKNDDINAIKDAWDIYSEAADKRISVLQDTIDDTQKAIQDARDFAYKQQQDALDRELQYYKLSDSVAKSKTTNPNYSGESIVMSEKVASDLEEKGIYSNDIIALQNYLNQGYSLKQVAHMTNMPGDIYNAFLPYITTTTKES